jgi:hypothetical protein
MLAATGGEQVSGPDRIEALTARCRHCLPRSGDGRSRSRHGGRERRSSAATRVALDHRATPGVREVPGDETSNCAQRVMVWQGQDRPADRELSQ